MTYVLLMLNRTECRKLTIIREEIYGVYTQWSGTEDMIIEKKAKLYEEIGLPLSWARVHQAKRKSIARPKKGICPVDSWPSKDTVWPEKTEGMKTEKCQR